MITWPEAQGKTLTAFHTSRMGDTLGIEFSDNTILFFEVSAGCYPDGSTDVDIDVIDNLSSDNAYHALLDLLEQRAKEKYDEIQKPLEDISSREWQKQQDGYERGAYERLKAKFEGHEKARPS
jgi:hypothetical protein